jgi:signal transduction histidine kinase
MVVNADFECFVHLQDDFLRRPALYSLLMTWRPSPLDYLVAGVVGLFAVTEEISGRTLAPDRHQPAWWIAAGVAAAVLILVRRRAPFAVLCAYSVANVASLAFFHEMAAAWQFYTQIILLFTLFCEARLSVVKAAAGVVATLCFVGTMAFTPTSIGWGDVAVAVVMTALGAGAGFAVRRHRLLAVQAAERSELLAREAVFEERARIARELHDIVAHSVSVMTMQTGGVRLMLPEDREREREVLSTIEETGRQAVDELRRMLGLLRGPRADGLTPQPSLDRLDDLVEQVRSAGLEVKVDVKGDPVPLPAGLGLSAYRIVQEALTNTLKHAGPTEAVVTITYQPRALHLEIVDRGENQPKSGEGGHGLIGMRERVALFYGSLTAGPLPARGYGVHAELPL